MRNWIQFFKKCRKDEHQYYQARPKIYKKGTNTFFKYKTECLTCHKVQSHSIFYTLAYDGKDITGKNYNRKALRKPKVE